LPPTELESGSIDEDGVMGGVRVGENEGLDDGAGLVLNGERGVCVVDAEAGLDGGDDDACAGLRVCARVVSESDEVDRDTFIIASATRFEFLWKRSTSALSNLALAKRCASFS
jgi:hypothetical protein